MADNGKLYPAFDMDYVKKNAELCAEADIIVPNITEASLMTGMEYREEYDESYVKELLARLNELGAGISVLTGVSLEKGKTGVMGYERETGEYYIYQNRRIDAAYHGTGDLFTSTCVGQILRGLNWRDAMRIAADYTAHTIEVTLQNPDKPWYGVDFEATIPDLIIVLCSLPVAVIFIFLVFLNQNSLLPHILQGGEKLFFPVTPTLPQRTADILMICTYHFPSLQRCSKGDFLSETAGSFCFAVKKLGIAPLPRCVQDTAERGLARPGIAKDSNDTQWMKIV